MKIIGKLQLLTTAAKSHGSLLWKTATFFVVKNSILARNNSTFSPPRRSSGETLAAIAENPHLKLYQMTRYEIALDEYNNAMAEGEAEKLIYAYFGAAVYYAQCLEECLSMMLWTNRIFKQQAKSSKEINEIIDAVENSRKTMGIFLNEVKQNYSLTEKHTYALKDVLSRRNYLVHKYFKLEIQKFHSDKGRKEMLKYFADFIDDSVSIDLELQKYFSSYQIRLGFTKEKISQLVEEMKQKELQRDIE